MSSSTTVGRPLSVKVLVLMTGASALLDALLGVLLLVAAADPTLSDVGAQEADPLLVRAVAVLVLLLALAQVGLAVGLWRGANAARLILTLVLVLRFASAWYLVGELGAQLPRGLVSLAAAVLSLFLLWNRRATAFFERDAERALAGSVTPGGRRRAVHRAGSSVLDFLVRLAILGLTLALSGSISAESSWSLVLAVLMIALAGRLLRPVLVWAAGLFGWFGSLMLALFSNAAIIGAGLFLTPGIAVSSVTGAVVASWIYALLMTVVTWVFSISTKDYLVVHAARMSMKGPAREQSDIPGVLFVQLDGVPAPVLANEVRAGNLPTISRWIRSGSHTWTEWVARVPSTTPVSQAGLLHGDNTDIPAFRWYDRGLGRLLVANNPADAAVIEGRLSDGNGLLADEGVSISNLFSGDAPTSLLTMSGLRDKQRGLGPSRSYAAFFTHPAGFLRAVLLTVGEMVKEVYQARRQERRGVEPRIHRHGSYVALRGITNVFLRDLNVALVVEAMMSGAKSIYVDFVDYDEIAHHAGVTRPESLASLYGLDEVLASLEALSTSGVTPRPYHIVLVSDHGQSQGATFRQRYGRTLEELIAELVEGRPEVAAATAEVEAYGPVNVFLGQLSGQASVSGRLTRRVLGDRDPGSAVGPGGQDVGTDDERPPLVVIGSGNLGGVWFAQHRERLLLSDMESLFPGLVQGLADHPGIGFVVAMTGRGPVAIGADGVVELETGTVTGTDPLAGYGPDARADFARAAGFANAPDLYVNSLYDPVLDEVAAFEELVGCHGGLGGWQTRPMLVYPSAWDLDPDLLDAEGRLYGADTVHRQFVRWLERLGHRSGLPAATAPVPGGGVAPTPGAATAHGPASTPGAAPTPTADPRGGLPTGGPQA